MSGLESLGLACNIFQAISFGLEVIDIGKRIYQNGSFNDSLAEYAVALGNVSTDIQSTTTSGSQTKKHEKDLVKIAEKCEIASRDLRDEISFIMGESAKGSLAKTLKVAAKTTWRKRRLERLERDLLSLENLMKTRFLVSIYNKSNAIDLEQRAHTKELKYFIQQYDAGYRDAKNLVMRQSQMIRDHTSKQAIELKEHIVKESQRSEMAMQRHIGSAIQLSQCNLSSKMADIVLDHRREAKDEKLLQSLKFSRINKRQNDIEVAHQNTFKWIFSESPDISSSFKSGPNGNPDNATATIFENSHVSSETEESLPESISVHGQNHPDPHWDRFPDWLRSDSKLYWVSGKPGSGKSTLIKFILHNPRTVELLGFWQRNCVLISHFFWSPGNYMQQSIKGMLCAVLYQLLVSSRMSQELVRRVPGMLLKDSDTDWSMKELLSVIDLVIYQYDRPLCIFLDGLDEISPKDGADSLLSIVNRLKDYASVKLCVSSRPEPLFRKRLQSQPHLHMQDLTKPDLESYARDKLGISIPQTLTVMESPNAMDTDAETVLSKIVSKAEGVFLWLCLAIKSVAKGIDNGDNMEEIEMRISNLPGDLVALYEDMWNRVNEDLPVYRRTAAHLLRLRMERYKMTSSFHLSMSVLEMTLASVPILNRQLWDSKPPVTADIILGHCEKLEKDIQVRCAGLLEITSERYESVDDERRSPEPWNIDYSILVPYASHGRTIGFVHRTAYDFLSDTLKGQKILQHDATHPIEIYNLIYVANLNCCQLFSRASFNFLNHHNVFYLLDILNTIPHDSGYNLHQFEELRCTFAAQCHLVSKRGFLKELEATKLSGYCSDLDFCRLCVKHNNLYTYVIGFVSRDEFATSDLSRLLLTMTDKRKFVDGEATETWFASHDELYRLLLKKGANPKHDYPTNIYGSWYYCFNRTATDLLVSKLLNYPDFGGDLYRNTMSESEVLFIFRRLELLLANDTCFKSTPLYIACFLKKRTVSYDCHFQDLRFILVSPDLKPARLHSIQDSFCCIIGLSLFTVVEFHLNDIRSKSSRLYQKPEVQAVVQRLQKMGQNSSFLKHSDIGSVVAMFKLRQGQIWDTDLKRIPYRTGPTDRCADTLLGYIHRCITRKGTDTQSVPHQVVIDYFEGAQSGHGSLFNCLSNLGILSLRMFTDENDVEISMEEAESIPGKVPSWRKWEHPGTSKVDLDPEELSDIKAHEECCKDWVSSMLSVGDDV